MSNTKQFVKCNMLSQLLKSKVIVLILSRLSLSAFYKNIKISINNPEYGYKNLKMISLSMT